MNPKVEIIRDFNSKVEHVFRAWTEPDQLTRWMGPGPVKCLRCVQDFNVGGVYEIHMETNEGIKIAFGIYRDIVLNQKLAFTWEWRDGSFSKSLVTIDFKSTENGSRLHLVHEKLPNQEQADHHQQGWEGCLVKLEAYLKALV